MWILDYFPALLQNTRKRAGLATNIAGKNSTEIEKKKEGEIERKKRRRRETRVDFVLRSSILNAINLIVFDNNLLYSPSSTILFIHGSQRSEIPCRNDSIDECFICHGLSSLLQTTIRFIRDKHNKMIRAQPNQAIVVEFLSHFSNNFLLFLLLSVSVRSMRIIRLNFPLLFFPSCLCAGNRSLPLSTIENGKRRIKWKTKRTKLLFINKIPNISTQNKNASANWVILHRPPMVSICKSKHHISNWTINSTIFIGW